MSKAKLKLKVNVDIGGKKKGDIFLIDVDQYGVPLDMYWRRRLKDAKIDNCCELLEETKQPKKDTKGGSK